MHISIIDDEKILANKILKKIQNSGYSASAFYGYRDFMSRGDAGSDLYIIDLSLGDGIGFDIVHWLRKNKHSRAPIIMISGYGDSENIVYGLDIGADDYLRKPIVPDELMARIKAVFRRPQSLMNAPVIRYKDISLNIITKEIKIGKTPVHLSKNESLIVETFLLNQKKVLSREKIISKTWGSEHLAHISDNTINVTLSNIRKKLDGNFLPKVIYKQGYILE